MTNVIKMSPTDPVAKLIAELVLDPEQGHALRLTMMRYIRDHSLSNDQYRRTCPPLRKVWDALLVACSTAVAEERTAISMHARRTEQRP